VPGRRGRRALPGTGAARSWGDLDERLGEGDDHVVDLVGPDHQRGKEPDHGAVPPTGLGDHPLGEQCLLEPGGGVAVRYRHTGAVGPVRVDHLDPHHEAPAPDVADEVTGPGGMSPAGPVLGQTQSIEMKLITTVQKRQI
jgi:hypothetical protein